MLSLKDPYSLVGRTLLDRYQIEALVGLGGMGAVYCAFHQGIERRVAIKVLQPNIALADERLVELFEREAKVAGRLTHENIVDVKDAGRIEEQGGTLAYIVMEWLDGRTLEDELQQRGQLGFAQTHEIARQMASALAEAHAKNVVHRDLKPANVMLLNKPNGRIAVKVLDFGIGKIVNQTGAAVSAVMGTPNYASPEQLQLGSKLDHRSDIYSMGVMLYRMIGGRLPFNSATLPELIQLQLNSTPTALRVLRPDVPAALETLVHQMLAKDADARPQTMP
ncbi:MAG: serine/threonine protein kinase, partial [Acidobacteria bacterium]|nr:serine/threonine protein kinase [Acidobacteriota bacterium]